MSNSSSAWILDLRRLANPGFLQHGNSVMNSSAIDLRRVSDSLRSPARRSLHGSCWRGRMSLRLMPALATRTPVRNSRRNFLWSAFSEAHKASQDDNPKCLYRNFNRVPWPRRRDDKYCWTAVNIERFGSSASSTRGAAAGFCTSRPAARSHVVSNLCSAPGHYYSLFPHC